MAEDVLHFGALRLRLQGSGNLRMQMIGLDNTKVQELLPLTMSMTPGTEPIRLANFKGQRASYKIYTNAIDEKFIINRIILFVKPIYTQYPG